MKKNVIFIDNFRNHQNDTLQKAYSGFPDEPDMETVFLLMMIERYMAMEHRFFILHHFAFHEALFWDAQTLAGIKIGCYQLLEGKGFTLGKPLIVITVAELTKLFGLFEFRELAVSFFHYGPAGIDRVIYTHSRKKEWRLTLYLRVY